MQKEKKITTVKFKMLSTKTIKMLKEKNQPKHKQ